jgi:hypothetical protein
MELIGIIHFTIEIWGGSQFIETEFNELLENLHALLLNTTAAVFNAAPNKPNIFFGCEQIFSNLVFLVHVSVL